MRTTGATGTNSTGVVRYQPANIAMSLRAVAAGRTMRIVVLNGAFYLDLGQPMAGKQWLRIDAKGTDPMSKTFAPLLDTMRTQSDPATPLTSLRGVPAVSGGSGGVVDGVPTRRYTIKLNSRQLLASLPATTRSTLGSALAGATSSTTYYVDAGTLPHKVVTVTTLKGRTSTNITTYSHWGQPVSIAAPPASQVGNPPAG
jgi:hypothetical protein